MLLRLTVTDFALLHRAEIQFHPGFTAITGETGAGKSLLVGALMFLAGGRPPFDVVRNGARHAVVEGEFLQSENSVLLIRRQIASDGRSRAFINDEPVGQKELADSAASLFDITSQRAFSRLLDTRQHLDLLDSFAGLNEARTFLHKYFSEYNNLEHSRKQLMRYIDEQRIKRDYLQRQLAEIDAVNPVEGEDTDLLYEVKRLEHFEELHRDGSRIVELLSTSRDSVELQLTEVVKLLANVTTLDTSLKDLRDEADNAILIVRELSRRISERCRPDGFELARLEELRQRQHDLASLARRYGGSIESAIQKQKEFRVELNRGDDAQNELEEIEFNLSRIGREWVELAKTVSSNRKNAALEIEKKVSANLRELGIGEPRFEILFEKIPDANGLLEEDGQRWRLNERGAEDAAFYFSANTGVETKPLATVASGGELSRIMLALKEAIPLLSKEATILFDEIDTGVSGKTAGLVGRKMKKISDGRQLIAITHLPQIASMADHHLCVVKLNRGEETFTEVQPLSSEERLVELAKMLSDGKISDEALKQAENLLSNNQSISFNPIPTSPKGL